VLLDEIDERIVAEASCTVLSKRVPALSQRGTRLSEPSRRLGHPIAQSRLSTGIRCASLAFVLPKEVRRSIRSFSRSGPPACC
jgi:hypothetical protein